jgi:hypothetical protein
MVDHPAATLSPGTQRTISWDADYADERRFKEKSRVEKVEILQEDPVPPKFLVVASY